VKIVGGERGQRVRRGPPRPHLLEGGAGLLPRREVDEAAGHEHPEWVVLEALLEQGAVGRLVTGPVLQAEQAAASHEPPPVPADQGFTTFHVTVILRSSIRWQCLQHRCGEMKKEFS
jgi:hypothetical protein